MEYIDPTTVTQARALYSTITQICYKAGIIEGDLERAICEERLILNGIRMTTREAFDNAFEYIRNEADGMDPIIVRETVKFLLQVTDDTTNG